MMGIIIIIIHLDEFAKFPKLTISFVMSVCPSACSSVSMEQLGFHLADFYEISYSTRALSIQKITATSQARF
jgi:hypothetical protein